MELQSEVTCIQTGSKAINKFIPKIWNTWDRMGLPLSEREKRMKFAISQHEVILIKSVYMCVIHRLYLWSTATLEDYVGKRRRGGIWYCFCC